MMRYLTRHYSFLLTGLGLLMSAFTILFSSLPFPVFFVLNVIASTCLVIGFLLSWHDSIKHKKNEAKLLHAQEHPDGYNPEVIQRLLTRMSPDGKRDKNA